MARLILIVAMALAAASASGTPDILPIAGIAGTMYYDLRTGQQTPGNGLEDRHRFLIWDSTQSSGYFFGGRGCMEIILDWGDVRGPVVIGAFRFGYATNADDGITCVIGFCGDDNGWNTQGREFIAAYELNNLAGTPTPQNPDLYWTWFYRVQPWEPFVINADDLDGDLLGDFSYTYWFDCATLVPAGTIAGPLIAGDPNAGTAPGIENAFDIFNDPDYYQAPGYIDPGLTSYVGTYWFGGHPFAQFYMALFAADCPNRGESVAYCCADIAYPYDCVVGLDDLAQLLGHFGMTTGATSLMGNIEPGCRDPWFCCDGDVDLADLAELLREYGDNCNWPRP